jgi:hypothetical protein
MIDRKYLTSSLHLMDDVNELFGPEEGSRRLAER